VQLSNDDGGWKPIASWGKDGVLPWLGRWIEKGEKRLGWEVDVELSSERSAYIFNIINSHHPKS
jgi:hypothetical protein